MKSKIFLPLLVAVTAFANLSYADHAVDNARYISRLAYDLADDSEALERQAFWLIDDYRDPHRDRDHWPIRFATTSDNVTFDHRSDTIRSFAYAARRLHLAASDLYRSASRVRFTGPVDHRGDQIRSDYRSVVNAARTLESKYSRINWSDRNQLSRSYRSVQRSLQRLQGYVYGTY